MLSAELLTTDSKARDAFCRPRCLVPVSALRVERTNLNGEQKGFEFRALDGPLFALARVWGSPLTAGGASINVFRAITVRPSVLLSDVFAEIPFAGLWEAWKDKEGHWLQSFTIVTTEANKLMSRIHPRMPVILYSRDYDRWLDREETERLPLDLLRPFESAEMEMFEANPKVGNVRNNGPELMRAASRTVSCRCRLRDCCWLATLSRNAGNTKHAIP